MIGGYTIGRIWTCLWPNLRFWTKLKSGSSIELRSSRVQTLYQIMLKPGKFVPSGLRELFADSTFSSHVHRYKRPERNSGHVQSCDGSRSLQLSLREAACVEHTFNKLITSPPSANTHTGTS
jgi:hypothetical protein